MGNGGFTIDVSAAAPSGFQPQSAMITKLDAVLTYLNPEPHRRTFMKPFMREDSAEFCSACHKVHLDEPVNNYRWLRGFNEYDNWQASGVSGQGARSFYYPAESVDLRRLPHAAGGFAAIPAIAMARCTRTASPRPTPRCASVNHDEAQLQGHRSSFCNRVSSRWTCSRPRRSTAAPRAKSRCSGARRTPGAGVHLRGRGRSRADRSGDDPRSGQGRRAAGRARRALRSRAPRCAWMPWCAPARSAISSRRAPWTRSMSGWSSRPWTRTGRVLAWSGSVEDDGRGPVDPGAHFYRSYQLDGEGNPINKRNAWQARSVLYVRLIPPGAADTVHFRLPIPQDAEGPITLEARLNYRKFSDYYTQVFASPAWPNPARPVSASTAANTRSIPSRSPTADRHAGPAQAASLWASRAGSRWSAQAGPRALERLGHRPAAARRSEGRRVRVPARDRGRARLSRWLAERRARADPGRRNRRRAAVYREGAGA